MTGRNDVRTEVRTGGDARHESSRRPPYLLALLAGIAALGLLLPSPGHAADGGERAVLVGRVLEAGSRAAVQGAAVRLENTRWNGVTDENGHFVFEDIPAGRYLLVVEHLAFQPVQDSIRLDDGGATYDLEITVSQEPIELDPISINVMRTGPLVDVYDRLDRMRRLGLGDVFDRDDIDRAGVSRVSHLISLLPGARLQPIAGRVGAAELRLHRRNNCAPSYYIDGIRTPMESMSVDDYVSLTAVEALEVYRRMTTLPGEFADERAQNCGAVAIWTRRGPPGHDPFGWRRLFVLVGFVSASMVMSSAFF